MYRNVYYNINDNWQGEIWIATWDKDGNRIEKTVTHNSYLYVEDKYGTVSSIYKTKLKKMEFESIASRKRWITDNPGKRIFECLPPVREYLLQEYKDVYEQDDFRKFDLQVYNFDIEIAVGDSFPKPENAEFPINVMTWHASLTDEYFIFATGDVDEKRLPKKANLIYNFYENEKDLLLGFCKWFSQNRPDIITGWNIDGFDIPYIINRLKKFMCAGDIDMYLSPCGTVRKRTINMRNGLKPIKTYSIDGVTILDYLMLFKDKFSKEKESFYSLEYIAQKYLGEGKLKSGYDTYKEFWEKDFTKYIIYNIRDVNLVVRLDKLFNLIDLTREVCNTGLCEYEGILKSSPYIFGALVLSARANNMRILSDNRETKNSTTYEGGFVQDTVPGYYKGGIATIDFNSLYPNVMITCNISPETKFAKIIKNTDDNVTIKLASGGIKQISQDDLKQILKTKVTLAKNGVMYFKPDIKKGIIPLFLEKLYQKRKDVKKVMKTISDKTQYNKLDRTQYCYKIFLNTIYGQLGSKYFPLFDIDNAEAITTTGQHLTKSAIKFVTNMMQRDYKFNGSVVLAGDTDSVMVNCQGITNKLLGDNYKWTDENISKVCNEFDSRVPEINRFVLDVIKNELHSPVECIEYARETFSTEADFCAKKKYVLHVRDDEGKRVDRFKYTGVDVKKKELPESAKDILRQVIEGGMIDDWPSEKYREVMLECWEKFKTIKNPEDLSYIKNYGSEKTMIGFMKAGAGAQTHARAGMYYNQLIKKLKIDNKYEEINVGDRIRYFFVKPNQYSIDTIGFKTEYPKEFYDIFTIDYELMFEKIICAPLKRFETNHKWQKITPGKMAVTDINSL